MILRNEAASPANSEEQACLVAEKFLPAVGMFTVLPERSNPPDNPQVFGIATDDDFVRKHTAQNRDVSASDLLISAFTETLVVCVSYGNYCAEARL